MTNVTELNLLAPIQKLIDKGILCITEGDEKIDIGHGHIGFPRGFILHKGLKWHKCWIWHKFWFGYYNIVPTPCQNYCWKVVVRLHTLPQLFEMYKLQQRLDRPGKCGIEGRPFVDALYGAYFYNTGINEGRECYDMVRDAVAEHISGDCEVLLKRACTEYELIHGPSDQWRVTRKQQRLEKMLNKLWVFHDWSAVPGKHRRAQIVENWIKWAAMHEPEEVYLQYIDKPMDFIGLPQKPRVTPLVTYHDNNEACHKTILHRQFV